MPEIFEEIKRYNQNFSNSHYSNPLGNGLSCSQLQRPVDKGQAAFCRVEEERLTMVVTKFLSS